MGSAGGAAVRLGRRLARRPDRAGLWRCSSARELSLFDPDILRLAETVLAACRARSWRVATAESCTGGLVAAALTAIADASEIVERSFVTYSNKAKIDLLGVRPET